MDQTNTADRPVGGGAAEGCLRYGFRGVQMSQEGCPAQTNAVPSSAGIHHRDPNAGPHVLSEERCKACAFGFVDDGTDVTTVRDFDWTTGSFTSPPVSTPIPGHHHTDSYSFTCSGEPRDVLRFRSCIPLPGSGLNPKPSGGTGMDGGLAPPEQSGPFSADVLCIVLLFIDASSLQDILQVSHTSRFWRYYANFSPHWTYFLLRESLSKMQQVPTAVGVYPEKPIIITREEYVIDRRKQAKQRLRGRIAWTAKYLRWCVAVAVMVGIMGAVNFTVAYFLGYFPTALRSDVQLGITTFTLMSIMSILETTVVLLPICGFTPLHNREVTMRLLSWGLLLLTVSILFGTISSLALSRVQAAANVLKGPVMDFTMEAVCQAYPRPKYPSFVSLPAPLYDIRWRPLTMDDTERTFLPYVLSSESRKQSVLPMEYVFLFFDASYNSTVFHNATELHRQKNVGTRTALGFDPIGSAMPIVCAWCSALPWPQIVALTTETYERVKARRDRVAWNDARWLDPAMRPMSYGDVSYRCSSDINREATEDLKGATKVWYHGSAAWKQHLIPLVVDKIQVRFMFEYVYNHYLHYATICYISSSAMWGALLVCHCVLQNSPLVVLGATTTAALLLLNPLTMAVSGVLCVHLSEWYTMCTPESGGALIGAGVALLLLLVTIYVSVHG